jgi:hypothetical protein
MITMGTTQHTAAVVGVAWLAEMQFSASTLRLCTAPTNLVSGGFTWTGVGNLGAVGAVNESADTTTEQLTLKLSVVDQALLSSLIADPASYRGRKVKLYLQLLTENWVVSGGPILRWSGVMNKVKVQREFSENQASSGSIELDCMRRGMDRARNYEGARMTLQQQQVLYPGDTGLRYMRELIAKPQVWLSKEFQRI